MRFLFLLFILSLPLVFQAQTGIQSTHTTTQNEKTREYILYIPQIYNGLTDVPLVINLHGYGSSMTEQIAYGDFRKIADTANFILLAPNGLLDITNKQCWNYFDVNGEDDIGFLSLLIDEISNSYSINTDRVYSTGMSNGGFMSIHLGCYLSNKITAVASVTGTMLLGQNTTCSPSRPVPTMLIHGTSDLVVPYAGNPLFTPVSSVVSHWVNQTNCIITPVITPIPNIVVSDNCTAEHHVYSGGKNGATVEHFKIIGGGHSWPGAPIDIDVTNHDFDASIEIWRFFSQYSTSALLSIKAEQFSLFDIYPNPSKGQFKISPKENIESIYILSSEGKLIHTFKNVSQEITINDLKPGIYYVQVYSAENSFSKKVVVN